MMKLVAVTCALFALLLNANAQTPQRPLFGTHFFYWYDAPNNNVDASRMPFDPPGLTQPFALPGLPSTFYSSRSVNWYRWQLRDLQAAGFDYAFPVSWGEGGQASWFRQSLLVNLRDAIIAENSPIKIGMYDDTTSQSAEWNFDNGRGYRVSTTDPNLQLSLRPEHALLYFYDKKIKPFFQIFPRQMWATHNGEPAVGAGGTGRPLILTFVISTFKDREFADELWAAVKQRFLQDFGVEPFVVLSIDWYSNPLNPALPAAVDGSTVYGAACVGTLNTAHVSGYTVANLGPGCETRLIGRPDFRDRWSDLNGADDRVEDQFLRDSFRRISANANLVVVESWNELWEGTTLGRAVNFPARLGGNLPADYYIRRTRALIDERKGRSPENTTLLNGGFEQFEGQMATSWTSGHLSGSVEFGASPISASGQSSLGVRGMTGFNTAAYQRVRTVAGQPVRAELLARLAADSVVRRDVSIGIDPAGGFDPANPRVVWSPAIAATTAWQPVSVITRAEGEAVTVFLRAASATPDPVAVLFDNVSISRPPVLRVEVDLGEWVGTALPISGIPTAFSLNGVAQTVSLAGQGSRASFEFLVEPNRSYTLNLKPFSFLREIKTAQVGTQDVTVRFDGPDGFGMLAGDNNNDNRINDQDLRGVTFNYGGPPRGINRYVDANGDGIVDDADLTILVLNFGLFGAQ